MDVNRDNFFSVLPEILQDINEGDYFAFDGEFTGILPLRNMSYFDTPTERYKRHYECDPQYLMIQFGLAIIRCTNPKENQYSLKAYNFFLFPDNEMDAFDFRSKSSSLQFLAANHFDFNQLFLKGIPSMQKTRYLDKLKQLKPSQQADAELEIERMVGFSEVIWKVQESGKPIIGHNLYTDVIHLINQFFTPIPASYEEYKSIVKSLFPRIIDTKLIASTSIFQDIMSNTALSSVYKTVREENFPQCHFDAPANFPYALADHEHTAGYDAMCTAICMARMMAYIAEQTNFKENPIQHPLIDAFIGKFFFMGSFDLKYSDMLNDDELPDRSSIFYVKHPRSWSPFGIRRYFQQWGSPFCETYDPTTEIVGLRLQNETTDSLLPKMRAGNKHLNIISYAQFHQLDPSKIKIRPPNPLFDIDPTKSNSNKKTRAVEEKAVPASPMDVADPVLGSTSSSVNPLQTATGHTNSSSRKNVSASLDEKRKPKT